MVTVIYKDKRRLKNNREVHVKLKRDNNKEEVIKEA